MKHKKIVVIALVILAAAAIGSVMWFNGNGVNSKKPQVISGRITKINNDCNADGICSVTLDNTKTIITGCGLSPTGTCKTYDQQSKLKYGQHIKATVIKREAGTYDLECESCTIRIVSD